MFDQIEETKLAAFYDEMEKNSAASSFSDILSGLGKTIGKHPILSALGGLGLAGGATMLAPAAIAGLGSAAMSSAMPAAALYGTYKGMQGIGKAVENFGKKPGGILQRLMGHSQPFAKTQYSEAGSAIKKFLEKNGPNLDPTGMEMMKKRQDWNDMMHNFVNAPPEVQAKMRTENPLLGHASYDEYYKARQAQEKNTKQTENLKEVATGAGIKLNPDTGKYEHNMAGGIKDWATKNPGTAALGVGGALMGLEGARHLAGEAFGEDKKKKGPVIING